MSKNKIQIESVMELTQAVQYLERVLNSIKEGSINVEKSGESITLVPESIVSFEMSLSQKKDKEKISFEISWRRDPKAEAARNVQIGSEMAELNIS